VLKQRNFSAKVLLFGEYSIIQKSMGLALPLELFSGHLSFEQKANQSVSNKELRSLAQYIKHIKKQNKIKFFDLESFEFDLNQGLYFDSSIPEGYGAGSSGALCAALYHQYVEGKDSILFNNDNLLELKENLALVESHFHGSSSGFDPLLSFVNRPMLFQESKIDFVDIPQASTRSASLYIFLLDTGRSRKTGPLVSLFLEKLKNPDFERSCLNILNPLTNNCIDAFLTANTKLLWEKVMLLSDFQYQHFLPMIPPIYHDFWMRGLREKQFTLKLCGAGGGGFLLGMTQNFEQFKRDNPELESRIVAKI
jgi:mevalonate kinase